MKRPSRPKRPKPDPSLHPEPIRTCLITRASGPAVDLLRLSAGPDGVILVGGKADGRGAWASPTAAVFKQLVAEPGRVAKALDIPTADTSTVWVQAKALTQIRVRDFLSLCSRSGQLASGAEMATSAVRAGDAAALIVASDASAGSLDDIRGAREIPTYTLPLDRIALGQQIGKGPRAVIALRRGGPAVELLRWLERSRTLAD